LTAKVEPGFLVACSAASAPTMILHRASYFRAACFILGVQGPYFGVDFGFELILSVPRRWALSSAKLFPKRQKVEEKFIVAESHEWIIALPSLTILR
jgi:hypothetical protein